MGDIRKSVYFYDDEHFKKVLILELNSEVKSFTYLKIYNGIIVSNNKRDRDSIKTEIYKLL